MKLKIPLWVKLAVSIILLFFLFKNIDLIESWRNVRNVPPVLILLALLVNLVAILINSYRWAIIIPVSLTWQKLKPLVIASYLGTFYSVFLPSALGGDVVKWGLARQLASRGRLATSILIDRVLGLITSTVISLLALLYLYLTQPNSIPMLIFEAVGFIGILVLGASLILFVGARLFPTLILKLPIPDRFKQPHLLKLSLKQIVVAFVISFFNQLFLASVSFALIQAFGISLGFASLLLVIQLGALISTLPISLGGFGTNELSFVYLVGLFGATGPNVMAYISLLVVLRLVIIALSGALGWGLKVQDNIANYSAKAQSAK